MIISYFVLEVSIRDFPGGPVVKTSRFHCKGHGFIPAQGTKIPHSTQHSQKKKKSVFIHSPAVY